MRPVLLTTITCLFHPLKCHDIFAQKQILNYYTKKISIGVKITCEDVKTYDLIKVALRESKIQFYSHESKDSRKFKAVMYGLDGRSADEVKIALVQLGFKCTDVKAVVKKYEHFEDTLFIVYFERGTVKLIDLRQKVKSLFRTIIKWDFQRKIKNRVIQCHKCQMFGHGERFCSVNVKCSNCAGNHHTNDCKALSNIRCANCNGNHKSTFAACPNRSRYLEIRDKINNRDGRRNQISSVQHSQSQNCPLPATTNIHNSQQLSSPPNAAFNPNWRPSMPNNSVANELFSEQEITNLTLDIVNGLKNCTNKNEQFNVIAQLAIKYLYSNYK